MKNVINKHKSNKIKENSNTVRHLNNGTDRRHSKSCCDQSSAARRTISIEVQWTDVLSISDITTYMSITCKGKTHDWQLAHIRPIMPGQNGHAADVIFTCMSWTKVVKCWFQFRPSSFLWVLLRTSQHWFRLWLGGEQATSHYMNQCGSWSVTPYGVTGPQWVSRYTPLAGNQRSCNQLIIRDKVHIPFQVYQGKPYSAAECVS